MSVIKHVTFSDSAARDYEDSRRLGYEVVLRMDEMGQVVDVWTREYGDSFHPAVPPSEAPRPQTENPSKTGAI